MKITEKELREIIKEEIVNQLPEDDFENDGINWPDEDEFDEDEEVMKMLMELCSQGQMSFSQMRNELQTNPYIIENPQKFKKLLDKIEALCGQIERIWDED